MITCCEFRQIELGKDKDKLLSRMYEELKKQILDGKKELWCQNRVAYVRYRCCDRCMERIKHVPVKVNLKSWYPKFLVRYLVARAIVKENLKNANKNKS